MNYDYFLKMLDRLFYMRDSMQEDKLSYYLEDGYYAVMEKNKETISLIKAKDPIEAYIKVKGGF